MEIQLNKEYKIVTFDELNYVLYKKRQTPDNKTYIKTAIKTVKTSHSDYRLIGYYCKLEHLFDDLIERHIKLLNVKSFEEIILLIENLKKSFVYQLVDKRNMKEL